MADTLGHSAAAADSASFRKPPGLGTRASRAVRNFTADSWYVVTSPARIQQIGWVKPLAVIGTTALLYAYDEEITRGFHRSTGNEAYDDVVTVGEWVEGTGYPGRTFPYYIGGTLLGYVFRAEPVKQAGLEILETQLISGGIRNLATLLIGRRREHEGRGAYFFEFNGGTSFPSGHTSSNFQLAAILSHHVDRKPFTVLLYTVAAAACVQRVDSRSHWPSDVFLSAIEGSVTARTVIRRNEERRNEGVAFSVFPDRRGLVVQLRF